MQSILIVEDDKDVRNNIAEMLNYEGYEVFEAEDGESGCKLAQELHPDLILCDILMPEMDGYSVREKVKNIAELDDVPFIFLTALSEPEDVRKGMDSGADDYLSKPFTRTGLLNSVKLRLEKRKNSERRITQRIRRTVKADRSLPLDMITPLNSIISYSDLLANSHEYDYLDVEKTRSLSKEINKSALVLLEYLQVLGLKDELDEYLNQKDVWDIDQQVIRFDQQLLKDWLDTGSFFNFNVQLNCKVEPSYMKIFNEHLFKLLEIAVEFFQKELGGFEKVVCLGIPVKQNHQYSLVLEMTQEGYSSDDIEDVLQKFKEIHSGGIKGLQELKFKIMAQLFELTTSSLILFQIQNGVQLKFTFPLV